MRRGAGQHAVDEGEDGGGVGGGVGEHGERRCDPKHRRRSGRGELNERRGVNRERASRPNDGRATSWPIGAARRQFASRRRRALPAAALGAQGAAAAGLHARQHEDQRARALGEHEARGTLWRARRTSRSRSARPRWRRSTSRRCCRRCCSTSARDAARARRLGARAAARLRAVGRGAVPRLVRRAHRRLVLGAAAAGAHVRLRRKGPAYSGVAAELPAVVLTAAQTTAAAAQAACTDAICVVPAGLTLTLDASLNVGALIVRGAVRWDDATQTAPQQWLCAGYVAVEPGGLFNLTVLNAEAFVYIKDNSAYHPQLATQTCAGGGADGADGPCPPLGARAFGGVGTTIEVAGRPLRRTWSLLAKPAAVGSTSLSLLHDPQAMGWRDRRSHHGRANHACVVGHRRGVHDRRLRHRERRGARVGRRPIRRRDGPDVCGGGARERERRRRRAAVGRGDQPPSVGRDHRRRLLAGAVLLVLDDSDDVHDGSAHGDDGARRPPPHAARARRALRPARRARQVLHTPPPDRGVPGVRRPRQRRRAIDAARPHHPRHPPEPRRGQRLRRRARRQPLHRGRERDVQSRAAQRGDLPVGEGRGKAWVHGAGDGQWRGGHRAQPGGALEPAVDQPRGGQPLREPLQRDVLHGELRRRGGARRRAGAALHRSPAARPHPREHDARPRTLRNLPARAQLPAGDRSEPREQWAHRPRDVRRLRRGGRRPRRLDAARRERRLRQRVRRPVRRGGYPVSRSFGVRLEQPAVLEEHEELRRRVLARTSWVASGRAATSRSPIRRRSSSKARASTATRRWRRTTTAMSA